MRTVKWSVHEQRKLRDHPQQVLSALLQTYWRECTQFHIVFWRDRARPLSRTPPSSTNLLHNGEHNLTSAYNQRKVTIGYTKQTNKQTTQGAYNFRADAMNSFFPSRIVIHQLQIPIATNTIFKMGIDITSAHRCTNL